VYGVSAHGRTANIAFKVTPAMKAALEIEAWESGEKNLGDYIRKLLETRGKFARSVGKAGGYLVQGPAKAGGSA
jgi:hypothetical protein